MYCFNKQSTINIYSHYMYVIQSIGDGQNYRSTSSCSVYMVTKSENTNLWKYILHTMSAKRQKYNFLSPESIYFRYLFEIFSLKKVFPLLCPTNPFLGV